MPLTVAEGAMLGLGMVFAGGGEDALHMNLLESPSSRSLCPPLPPKPHLYPPTAAATFAYKRKQTTAFKLAYFMAWPTLGSAALWVLMPDQQQMEKVRGRPGAGSWDVGPHCGGWRARQCTHAASRALAPQLHAAACLCPMPLPQQLKDSGYSQRQLDASRAATQAQLAHLRAAAENGRARREGQ